MAKRTTEQFISELKVIHGEAYDVSEITEYVNNKTPVKVTCTTCGTSKMARPDKLLRGVGCSICYHKRNAERRLSTVESVLKTFKKVHKDKYLYPTFTKPVKSKDKIDIECTDCGEKFKQQLNSHVRGHGCPNCAKIQQVKDMSCTTEDFIAQSISKFSHLDYSKVRYINCMLPVTLHCNKCNITFSQSPNKHLRDGGNGGCPSCKKKLISEFRTGTKEDFLLKAEKVHGSKYDYSNIDFKNMKSDKIGIKCKTCSTVFYTIPSNHVNNGSGCPSCNSGGFNTTKPGILYYLSVNNGETYKIGITNRSVELRFIPSDLKKIQVVKTWRYEDGLDCLYKETEILRKYKEFQYKGIPLLENGNTELFTKDVLELDNLKQKDNK